MANRLIYPTQQRLKELFYYHEGGHLIWKKERRGVKYGSFAGSINKTTGYNTIYIDGKYYRAHRLIFIFHKGYDPENDVDHHPDRTKSNNRIENLREATRSCNMKNIGNISSNTSGVKGVGWHKEKKCWFCHITIMCKVNIICTREDFDETVLHRLAAEQCLDWESCNSSSPAYQYAIENNLIRK